MVGSVFCVLAVVVYWYRCSIACTIHVILLVTIKIIIIVIMIMIMIMIMIIIIIIIIIKYVNKHLEKIFSSAADRPSENTTCESFRKGVMEYNLWCS